MTGTQLNKLAAAIKRVNKNGYIPYPDERAIAVVDEERVTCTLISIGEEYDQLITALRHKDMGEHMTYSRLKFDSVMGLIQPDKNLAAQPNLGYTLFRPRYMEQLTSIYKAANSDMYLCGYNANTMIYASTPGPNPLLQSALCLARLK